MKYLKFYNLWAESKVMPFGGLCNNFVDSDINLFRPKNASYWKFWAFNSKESTLSDSYMFRKKYEFTPTRQNIVLLMAAMNGEL